MPALIIYFIVFIVAVVVAIALAPKPADPVPASLEDLNLPTAEPGRPIPVVFGTYTIKCSNVVWYGDLGTEPVKTGGCK